jgi:hypothetical protein
MFKKKLLPIENRREALAARMEAAEAALDAAPP